MPRPKPQEFVSEQRAQAEWSGRARCRNLDPSLFDTKLVNKQTGMTDEVLRAKEYCLSCPVMMSCLEHAVAYDIRTDVWGGMVVEERDAWAARQDELVAA